MERISQDDGYGGGGPAGIDRILSLMEQLSASLSPLYLEPTIALFKQILELFSRVPLAPALQFDALHGLAVALGMLYVNDEKQETLAQFLEIGSKVRDVGSFLLDDVDDVSDEDGPLRDMLKTAQDSIVSIRELASLRIINLCVPLLHKSVVTFRPGHRKQFQVLTSLASGAFLRFLRQPDNPAEMHLTISIIKRSIQAFGKEEQRELKSRLQFLEVAVLLGQVYRIPEETKTPEAGSDLQVSADSDQTREDAGGIKADMNAADSVPMESSAPTDEITNLGFEAHALMTKSVKEGDKKGLQKGIKLYRQALQLTSADDPRRSVVLANLAGSLHALYQHEGNTSALEEAITFFKQAIELMPAPHTGRASTLDSLATALCALFEEKRDSQSIQESLSFSFQGLELRSAEDPDRAISINNIASAYLLRFQEEENLEDLNMSISLCAQAITSTPASHSARPALLGNIATSFYLRFQAGNQLQDLDFGISFSRQLLRLRPRTHPERLTALMELARQLLARAELRLGDEGLEEAISLYRQALELTDSRHPGHVKSLNGLSDALLVRFEQTMNLRDVEEVISLYKKVLELLPLRHEDRFDPLSHLASAMMARFDLRGDIQDLDEALSLYKQTLEIPPTSDLARPFTLVNIAQGLLKRSEQQSSERDLEEAVSFSRQALDLTPAPHPHRTRSMRNLATVLTLRFEQEHNVHDVDEAILLYKEVIRLPPSPPVVDHTSSLINLSQALRARFKLGKNIRDLDEAIMFSKEAVKQAPLSKDAGDETTLSLPGQVASLQNLASMLLARVEHRENAEDLDQAIALCKKAVELQPLPYTDLGLLKVCSRGLIMRFEQRGASQDLDDAISVYRQGLDLTTAGDADHTVFIDGLASCLYTRFGERGHIQDLDDAISSYYRTLELTPSSKSAHPDLLDKLAGALHSRFEVRQDLQDLHQAIALFKQFIEIKPSSDPFHVIALTNCATVLLARFHLTGETQDLEDSIALSRQTLEPGRPSHPDISVSLNNLANGLLARFDQNGDIRDIDEAISYHRQALALKTPLHPTYSNSLENLAAVLMRRFEKQGNSKDLNEAIPLQRQALERGSATDPDFTATLNNLAMSLTTKFQRESTTKDFMEAVLLHRQAFELVPPEEIPHIHSFHNVFITLSTLFDPGVVIHDFEEAISIFRQTLELLPADHPKYLSFLIECAISLSIKFNQDGNSQYFSEGISFFEQVLTLLPLNDPRRPSVLFDYAGLHAIAQEKLGAPVHVEKAISLLSEATRGVVQSPRLRFRHAVQWAQYADKHQHPVALEAFSVALDMLPELAAVSPNFRSRQDMMTDAMDRLARRAAKCAIRNGNFGKAVEFLETERTVSWSQILRLRSPFDQVSDIAPQLANSLRWISEEYEKEFDGGTVKGSWTERRKVLDGEGQRLEQLAKEWADAVNSVRKLDGNEGFIRPQSLSTLKSAAMGRPVVYLIANDDGSDCLIMTSQEVHHIPLPTLPEAALSEMIGMVRTAVSDAQTVTDQVDQPGERGTGQQSDVKNRPTDISNDLFKRVLGMLWKEVVKPVISFLGFKKSQDTRMTLTWCTMGLFSFLPIHAAGQYDDVVECVSDYIVSSYLPTIGGLRISNHNSPRPFKMVAVLPSQTSPRTDEELKQIQVHVPEGSLIKLGTPTSKASVQSVASSLGTADVVHFACGARQVSNDPLENGLEVGNEILTIAEIMKSTKPNACLAVLTGCDTRTRDENITGEAMNVPTSLLFTGFRSVVATMWKIADQDAPIITGTFYRELFQGPDGKAIAIPDTSRSAEALSIAVDELRRRGVDFKRWVPFIHMGR